MAVSMVRNLLRINHYMNEAPTSDRFVVIPRIDVMNVKKLLILKILKYGIKIPGVIVKLPSPLFPQKLSDRFWTNYNLLVTTSSLQK